MAKKSSIKPAETVQYIVNWLRAYAENAKVNGFVVGISGGIDSAVTSALCARTGLITLCVEMPIHQPPQHVTRAQEHIAWLKSEFSNVDEARTDLTPVFEIFKSSLPTSGNEHSLFLTLANTRARLRMTTLYYHAGLNGLLVAGTGNKVEDFGVGFFTKYGDGGVDVSPIADLMKSDVYALAEEMGVSEAIRSAAPADGLFTDDRSDEDQLGASYDELEWAMTEWSKNRTASEFSGREKEVFEIFVRLNNANRHKMIPIPVCEIPSNLKLN